MQAGEAIKVVLEVPQSSVNVPCSRCQYSMLPDAELQRAQQMRC